MGLRDRLRKRKEKKEQDKVLEDLMNYLQDPKYEDERRRSFMKIEQETNEQFGTIGFDYLNGLVNAGSKEILLERDITFDELDFISRNGILIQENDITIDGNGHTIDAYSSEREFHKNVNGRDMGEARIFVIRGKNVTLKNITFKNASSEAGSAVAIKEDSNVNISNCRFIDMNSEKFGGAIYVSENSSVKIENCEFEDNSAKLGGGALFTQNNPNIKINDCTFKNCNSKDGNGGVINIQNETELHILNCEFIGNNAKASGVILSDGTANIENSRFINNNAGDVSVLSVAIHGKVNILNCEFKNNSSKNWGVLSSENDLTVVNSKFENSTSEMEAGVIKIFPPGKIEVSGSLFIDSSAAIAGLMLNSGLAKFSDCKVLNSKANQMAGVFAVDDNANLKVSSCEFNDCSSVVGGIVINKGNVEFSKCVFNNCRAQAGAIAVSEPGSIFNDFQCQYNNCISEKGENIMNVADYM